MLNRAKELAEKAHQGQRDKGGQPYILHPLRVMENCETTEEKIVALLHDTIEDTEMTLERLRAEGFSERVLEAIDCLTHRADEPYMAYIVRVCENRLAARVKLADLQDNMNLSRIPHPNVQDYSRLEKYRKAKACIEKALEG